MLQQVRDIHSPERARDGHHAPSMTKVKAPLRFTIMIPSAHSNALPAGKFLVDKVVVVTHGFCFVVVSVCSLPFSEV